MGDSDIAPSMTGYAAYRATVDVKRIAENPELAWLLKKPSLNIWIGDQRHVMSYLIAGGQSFNMVLSHPEKSDPATWKTDSVLADMKAQFYGWDTR